MFWTAFIPGLATEASRLVHEAMVVIQVIHLSTGGRVRVRVQDIVCKRNSRSNDKTFDDALANSGPIETPAW
jgi:hypothetical protein